LANANKKFQSISTNFNQLLPFSFKFILILLHFKQLQPISISFYPFEPTSNNFYPLTQKISTSINLNLLVSISTYFNHLSTPITNENNKPILKHIFLCVTSSLFGICVPCTYVCLMVPQMQIQNLEHEIQEKRKQMRLLEQQIIQSGEASVANASLIDMQQVLILWTFFDQYSCSNC